MASKTIDIKLSSSFNADGVLEANKGLAKIAQDVKAANAEMQKASLRAEMSVNSYAEQADKSIRAMGGGYKTLEQQLAELATKHGAHGDAATAAGKAIAGAADAGKKSFVSLEMIMGLCRGSTEQLAKAFGGLAGQFPLIAKMGVPAFGAIIAAVTSLVKFVSSAKDLISTAFNLNAVSKEITEATAKFTDLNNAAEMFAANMADARKEAERQAKIFEEEANALNKAAKASNELKRAQELSGATSQDQKDEINRRYNSMNAEADETTAQAVRDNRRASLIDEESRIQAEIRNAEKSRNEYRKMFGQGNGAEDRAIEQQEVADAKRRELENTRGKISALEAEDEAAQDMAQARRIAEATAARGIAQKKADEEAEAARKAAEEKAKADEAAAQKAVEAERKAREKMEADLHAQRIANAKAELQAAQGAAGAKEAAANNAQTEFDRAFAMYRSEDKGAAQIAEERDYAADYKRMKKDAARYGGKWRIDELSSLIAAGDTQGQAAKLEEWRKSSRFTPEVESMVRAAAADDAKTSSIDELRQINNNTKGLSDKLDSLLQLK